MDPLEIVTDRCIRRGLGFAGLAVGMVMLALSFDLPLALRAGASLVALTVVAMLLAAWHAPRRDMRHSEVWLTLNDLVPELVRQRPKQEVQQHLRRMMRRRLVWHAERVSLLSIGLWGLALLVIALRALF
ncbi:hypothetical protein [Falsiroseomonas sp.]|uniref:hypothetical protein n=1 Tax=Falsiroseomonas sp. TaxID=2870721 RepID=UPI00356832C2